MLSVAAAPSAASRASASASSIAPWWASAFARRARQENWAPTSSLAAQLEATSAQRSASSCRSCAYSASPSRVACVARCASSPHASIDPIEQRATANNGIRYGGGTVVQARAELLDARGDRPARLSEVRDRPHRRLLGFAVLAVQAAAHEGEHVPDPSERSCVAELL